MNKKIAKCFTAIVDGVDGRRIDVELQMQKGIPEFQIIGLGDATVKESNKRIKGSIVNLDIAFPNKRIVANLSPANVSKSGSQMDFAVAMMIVALSGQYKISVSKIEKFAFLGELSLFGDIKKVTGAIPMLKTLIEDKCVDKIFISIENIRETELLKSAKIVYLSNLKEAIDLLERQDFKNRHIYNSMKADCKSEGRPETKCNYDHLLGQRQLKRILSISSAGGHNLLLVGSPGVGKSMAAQLYSSLLPPLKEDTALEIMSIYDVARLGDERAEKMYDAPFRKASIMLSKGKLFGGSTFPLTIGECSLAHGGVLFLDEMDRISYGMSKELCQVMDDRKVVLHRKNSIYKIPADFILIGAMTPCRCGYYGEDDDRCTCSEREIFSYRKKLAGGLFDRMDLQVRVKRNGIIRAYENEDDMTFEDMKKLVSTAREVQRKRGMLNGQLNGKNILEICDALSEAKSLLDRAYDSMKLSHRGYFKALKIARTIADMENEQRIQMRHVAEALQYRWE